MRILLVEDDDRVVRRSARPQACQPGGDRAATAAEAMARHQDADLILLDMGLPDQDGYAVCQQIRELNPVPIIAVTARREEASVVAALRAGVDDYVTKPYRLAELMARIEAVMRRYGEAHGGGGAEYGGIRVDTGSRQAYVDGSPSRWRARSSTCWHAGAEAGELVTRETIMEAIWETTWVGASRTIDVHVAIAARQARPAGADRDGARHRLPDWRRPDAEVALTSSTARSRPPCVGLLLVALMAPLVNATPRTGPRTCSSGRLAHVTRFAVLAENALEAGDARTLESTWCATPRCTAARWWSPTPTPGGRLLE